MLVGVAYNVAQILGIILVFFSHFGDVDPNSWMTSLKTSLIVFVFFKSLGLDLGLSLKLTCISKRRIITKLSLISISMIALILNKFALFGLSVIFWAYRVNLS